MLFWKLALFQSSAKETPNLVDPWDWAILSHWYHSNTGIPWSAKNSLIHLIPWRFAIFSTDGVSSVCNFKHTCSSLLSCMWWDQSKFMALFYGCNFRSIPGLIFWVLQLFLIFSIAHFLSLSTYLICWIYPKYFQWAF